MTAKDAASRRKRAKAPKKDQFYDKAMLDDLPTPGARALFMRQGGLEPEDFGLRNWIGGASPDPDVQLHQAIHGSHPQAYGRTWGAYGASDFLTTKQFRKGYDAIALANSFGEVLATFISISWSTVGVTEPDAVMEAQKRYLELLRKWCKHRNVLPAWVWVIENGKTYGLHSHILVHVPHALKEQLAYQVETAVATIAGQAVKKRRRGTKGDRTIHVVHRRDDDVRAQWQLFRYMMKGIRPTKREKNPERRDKQVVIERIAGLKLRRQGLVVRQRFGVARSLNTRCLTANREHAQLPPNALERGETRPELLFTDEYVQEWYDSQLSIREAAAAEEHERMQAELLRTLHI